MFSPRNPDEIRAMLLHMAVAASGAPTARAKVARWLRAALALVEDEEEGGDAVAGIPGHPATAKALEELAFSLSVAQEHAEYLAEQAAVTTRSPRWTW